MQNNSRRQAEVVLRSAEEAGLQEISLDTPTEDGQWFEVDASANRVGEGSVGAQVVIEINM